MDRYAGPFGTRGMRSPGWCGRDLTGAVTDVDGGFNV
jgi:hypothetical protein